MARSIKLSIDCVNKVKVEKLGEFGESIFGDVYQLAHMQVGRIMEMTRALNIDDDAEKFCNGNEMSNVISFVGERGMGKSSAMLSFAYFLKQYPSNLREEDTNFKFKKINKENKEEGISCKFYILPKIDVATLTNETLFDVVLAKMWTDFNEKTGGASEDRFGFSHTKESFNSIKDAYTLYYKDEKQNKNLTSVRQLQELSRSLALREQFAKLVESFLEYIIVDNGIAAKDRFLVIPIDDLDLANDMKLAILEQIRIFLSVPQVIILTTVDIEKLSLSGNKKFSDELICQSNVLEYEKSLVRQYSERYIAKVLPRNSRIYMPRYGGTEAKNYVLEYGKFVAFLSDKVLKNGDDVDYITYINMITAKHLNLIVRYKDTLSFSAESIRNIVNKLNELWSICKYYENNPGNPQNAVLEWLEKESIISNNVLSSQSSIDFMRKLRVIAAADCNQYIVDYLGKDLDIVINGYSYGDVLCVLCDLENSGFEDKEMAKAVIMFYSMQIVKYLSQERFEEIDSFFVRNNIFSGFFMSNSLADLKKERAIDNLLQLSFECDNEEKSISNIIFENRKHITDIFRMFLFCNMDSVIESCDFEVKFRSDSAKDIPGAEKVKGNEKKQFSIGTVNAVSNISIENFFNNVIRYEDLYKKYIKWIYLQLERLLGDDILQMEISMLNPYESFPICYSKIRRNSMSGVRRMSAWKEDYKIDRIYDLLPVQDVGVMVGVIERLSALNVFWRDISSMMHRLSEAFQKEFEEAEDACAYNAWGYKKYSEKLSVLMNIIELDKIPREIKDRLVVTGQRTEDTTTFRRRF